MSRLKNKNIGILSAVELKKFRYKLLYWGLFGMLILVVFIATIPSVWILLSGFKTVKEIYSIPPSFFPKNFDITKIATVWGKLQMGRGYLNSIALCIGEIVFAVVINALAGYVLSRIKPRGSAIVFAMIVWTMMMPGSIRTVPIYMQVIEFTPMKINMLGTYWPMWFMAGANCFSILLFKNFFDSISIFLVEAARIDGAKDLQIFFKLILPMSVPVLAYVGITTAQNSFGGFFWPNLIISQKDSLPLAALIFRMKKDNLSMDQYFMALVFSIIPSAVIFIFFQKHIMGGINIGGVKG